MTKKILTKLLLGVIVPTFSACSELPVPDAPLPSIPDSTEIIILGEVHDNPQHHLTQAAYIRALKPSAVAFEMLTSEQAKIANSTKDRGVALGDALKWQDSGWPPWPLYQPVFQALEGAEIYGMALPRELVRRAVNEGAAAVFAGDPTSFGLHKPLPEGQQNARESHQQSVHCNMLPPSLLGGMVEAQRLRDASFALTALTALEETGGPVVIIAGTGHTRKDWGIPAALAKASPATRVVSIGLLERNADNTDMGDSATYDVSLLADAVEREDPCLGFAVQSKE